MEHAAFITSPAVTLQSLTPMAQIALCFFLLNTGFPEEPVLCQLSIHGLCIQLYSHAEISHQSPLIS